MHFRYFVLGILFLSLACGQKSPEQPQSLKINHLQLIGSHNSYKLPVPTKIMEAIASNDSILAASLDYAHPPVWEQLDMGLRLFELDVYRDPEGGRFSEPLGQAYMEEEVLDSVKKAAFDQPGFKVFHVQDIDFRSHYPLLEDYLKELGAWSSLHPDHLPVFITVNAKDTNYPGRGMTEALPFGDRAFIELDELILQVLGESKLITPKEIIGTHEDLKTAVKESGWPGLQESRGKFIWILDEKGVKLDAYLSRPEGSSKPVFSSMLPNPIPCPVFTYSMIPLGNSKLSKTWLERDTWSEPEQMRRPGRLEPTIPNE